MEDTQVSTPEPRQVIVPKKGSALRKLAEDDSSRKKFLKMVGGAGAASSFAILLAACGEEESTGGSTEAETAPPDDSEAASKDLDILNYALTLEFLEAKFYQDVLNANLKPPQAIAEAVTTFGEHEAEHVDALTATIEMMGGTPVEDPNGNFESVLKDLDTVLATAARVENVGAAAYLSEAGSIQSPEVLAAALSIHTVEARHAAALNSVAGLDFTGGDQFEGSIPDGPFAVPADRDTVMAEIQPFLPSGGGGN